MGRKKLRDIDRIRTQVWIDGVKKRCKATTGAQIDEALGMEKGEIWYKYFHGSSAPNATTRKYVDQKLPAMSDLFIDGPMNVFKIIELGRLQDVAIVINEEIGKLCESIGISILETPYCIEDSSLAVWMQGIGLDLYMKRKEYSFDDQVIPLAFAAAHAESRFLDYTGSLVRLVGIGLEYFESEFGVTPDYWKSDKDIFQALSSAKSYEKLDNLFSQPEV